VVGPYAGITHAEAKLIAHGVLVLADNGLSYASDSICGVVLCATLDKATDTESLASVDLGSTIATAGDSQAAVRSCARRSRLRPGGLTNLGRKARDLDLAATVTITAGSATAEFRSDRWRTTSTVFCPGFAAELVVHR
jgi:hypothetical protein